VATSSRTILETPAVGSPVRRAICRLRSGPSASWKAARTETVLPAADPGALVVVRGEWVVSASGVLS